MLDTSHSSEEQGGVSRDETAPKTINGKYGNSQSSAKIIPLTDDEVFSEF